MTPLLSAAELDTSRLQVVGSSPTSEGDYHAISPMASRSWEKHGGVLGQEKNLEEISASQRMISATWGSILTSLLGTSVIIVYLFSTNNIWLVYIYTLELMLIKYLLQ
jgi:hypothetical protein